MSLQASLLCFYFRPDVSSYRIPNKLASKILIHVLTVIIRKSAVIPSCITEYVNFRVSYTIRHLTAQRLCLLMNSPLAVLIRELSIDRCLPVNCPLTSHQWTFHYWCSPRNCPLVESPVNNLLTDIDSELSNDRLHQWTVHWKVCQWSFHWHKRLVNSLLTNFSSERPVEFVSEMFVDNVCQWILQRQCLPIKWPLTLFTNKVPIGGVRHSAVRWHCLPVNYLLTHASELHIDRISTWTVH